MLTARYSRASSTGTSTRSTPRPAQVLWTALNADPLKGQTVTTAPVVVKDKLIIGVSGGEYGVLGYLSAFDLKTGKLVWRAYSAGSDEAMIFDPAKTINANLQQPVGKDSSIKTWSGDQWKLGGGTTWGWYSYDPKLNLIYYGTGNPGSWNPTQRPGDNRWSMSIIARNPDSGMAAWAFQLTPHDGWDYDGVNENVLFDATIGGQQSSALAHFDRNGYGYVLERDNGKLLAVHKYDPTVNWATSIDATTGKPEVDPTKMTKAGVNVKNICPAAEGDKDEQPSSYDPATHLFYVPTNHICMDYQAFDVKYKAGFPFVGALLNMYPASPNVRGRFIAFDAVSRRNQVGDRRHIPGLERCAHHRRWGGFLRHPRRVVSGSRSERREGPISVSLSLGHRRQPHDLHA